MSNFFSSAQSEALIAQIGSIENSTIGELRIHIEDLCLTDPYMRAIEVFNKLEMYKTIGQSGVLIYITTEDKKIAIIGDKGIHAKVGADYWTKIVVEIKEISSNSSIFEGILHGLNEVGKILIQHFPENNKPVNELSNEISYGQV